MNISTDMNCDEICKIDIVNDMKLLNMHDTCCKFILDKNNSDEDKIKVIKKYLSHQRKWAFISTFKLIDKFGFNKAYQFLVGKNKQKSKPLN